MSWPTERDRDQVEAGLWWLMTLALAPLIALAWCIGWAAGELGYWWRRREARR